MQTELLVHFNKNITMIEDSISIYQYLKSNSKNLDASFLLRAQFVLLVSAFDTFIHGFVIENIIDSYFEGKCDFNIDIPISVSYDLERADDKNHKIEILKVCMQKKLSKDTFQSPKSIEYAANIIGIKNLWAQLKELNKKPEDIKNQLALIVNRRNKIAHESDWNQLRNEYEDISLEDVITCKDFINNLVRAIFSLKNNKEF